jgi:molybdopterin synthase sulfur carrier subunit
VSPGVDDSAERQGAGADGARHTVRVHVGTPLQSYTSGRATLTVAAPDLGTVDGVLRALDRRAPGLRFRVVDELGRLRPHIRIFVAGVESRDLGEAVGDGVEVHVLAALSGG